MYAAVPCYNLSKLHQLVRTGLAACSHGLFQGWKQFTVVLGRQKLDPACKFFPELPKPSSYSATD